MGPGSVIYGHDINFTGGAVRGQCKMWQGIRVGDHGVLYANGTTFSDAEFCISIFERELNARLYNCTFSRNFASIYAPPTSLQNVFSYYSNPSTTSIIQNCTFDGNASITLPNYNGQVGKPLGSKSFAGFLLYNFKSVNSVTPASIPFSTSPSTVNTFKYLNFGIYAVNSDLDVNNCFFNVIQPVTAYTGTNQYNGTGIYSMVNIGSAIKYLKAGNHDAAGVTKHNDFTDCRRGIVTNNGIRSTIIKNNFLHPAASGHPSGTGIWLRDADNMDLTLQYNFFRDEVLRQGGTYVSTGIVITSATQSRKFLNMQYNTFENEKTAIYIHNSRGAIYQDQTFLIKYNDITFDITPAQLGTYNTTFTGMWLNAVSNGFIIFNGVYRPYPLSVEPPNYRNLALGMNVVNCTQLSKAGNDFTQYGSCMRYLSNCAGTTMKCNLMTAGVIGVRLDNANMTTQGWPGEGWENKWDGFPTPTSTTYNRADGIVVLPFDWFNREPSNTVSSYHRYSPEPVDPFKISAYPNQAAPGCAVPGGGGGTHGEPSHYRIAHLIEGEMEYLIFPEESRYLDQEFVYYALREDTALRDSIPDYQEYFDSLRTSNFGLFDEADELYQIGELVEALAQLDLIVVNSTIEYNMEYTRRIAINQKLTGNEELSTDEITELTNIAYTDPWVGGSGVFTARHLLNEQVMDFENNLRIARPVTPMMSGLSLSVYPNPAIDMLTVFYDSDEIGPLDIKITDLSGRTVMEKKLESNIIDIQSLSNGIYVVNFYLNGFFQSQAKITVLR